MLKMRWVFVQLVQILRVRVEETNTSVGWKTLFKLFNFKIFKLTRTP